MKIIRFPILSALALALVFAVAPLCAAGPYLHGFDPVSLLPPPPLPHGPEDVADRDSAFRVYSTRTPEEAARAKREHRISLATFAAAIGPAYSAGAYPKLEALCKDVELECRGVADVGKAKWKRLRPAVADPVRFTDPSDPETSFSYPSSHATRATGLALVLAEIFPARRAEILQKGRDIGWVRVEAGSHTPLDIYAGRVLGQALAQAFLRDPEFQSDLAAVKAEVAAPPLLWVSP